MKPRVSVLMPVYNGARYVQEAVESILQQTFTDFELIVVNDGSTDETHTILEHLAQKDNRIRLYQNSENKGLPDTRNRLLTLATGEFCAMMDSDDIALPTRLSRQVSFLEERPDITVCGSFVINLHKDREVLGNFYAIESEEIDLHFFFAKSLLANSSAMFRRAFLLKYQILYRADYFVGQDTQLWFDLKRAGARFYNLPEFLLYFRIHEKEGISALQREEQMRLFRQTVLAYVRHLMPSLTETEAKLWVDFCLHIPCLPASDVRKVINRIIAQNRQGKYYKKEVFEQYTDAMFKNYFAKDGVFPSLRVWREYQWLKGKQKQGWLEVLKSFWRALIG